MLVNILFILIGIVMFIAGIGRSRLMMVFGAMLAGLGVFLAICTMILTSATH